MFKKIISTIIACFCFYLAYSSYIVNNPPKPIEPIPVVVPKVELKFEDIISLIKENDAKEYIKVLSSKEFAGRGTGTEGNEKASEYIKQHLTSLGIEYRTQKFNARGKDTENIIGYIESNNSKNVIVIGAHFDHLGSRGEIFYPGADDNASGVASVMCIAKALSKYKSNLKNTILIQFYSAEEMGLLGSKYYVNNPIYPIENHIAMINLDMIGYLKDKYNTDENTTSYRDYDLYVEPSCDCNINLKTIVDSLRPKYYFANTITGYKPGSSDHAPFYNKGIPIVFLHTGTHPYYHTPSDTLDRLNFKGIESISRFAFEILIKIDGSF